MSKSENLSEFLKSKRVAANLTQMDVAEALGYTSAQFISNWERGLSSPPIPTLKKLCKMYKMSSDDVFHRLLTQTIKDVEVDLTRKFFKKTKSA